MTDSPCEILVIDFMNLLVRAWHAGKPSESHAVRSMFQTVASAVRALRPASLVFAMDGGYDHRTKILPSYKAHRPPSDPDLVRQRQLATDAIQAAGLLAVRIAGYEADDVIASIAAAEFGVVVCSSDKDLLSLSGLARVYHPWGAGKFATAEDALGVSPAQVSDYLALCGDTSDGVPGVRGIGPKTAAELLAVHGNLEAILSAARTLRIPGAAGKKIAEGTADALLSQQLVALVDNLPLPPITPWRPPAGWQQRLQDMRLGSVAAILDGLTPILTGERQGVSPPCCVSVVADKHGGLTPCRSPKPRALFDDAEYSDAESSDVAGSDAESSVTGPASGDVPPAKIIDLLAPVPDAEIRDASSALLANYAAAGFTITREFAPVPGTTFKPKHQAVWRDGSKWILDQNTRRHTCCSDSPVTEWTMDRRGPIDPKTNRVRGPH